MIVRIWFVVILALVFFDWLWNLGGKERIEFTPTELTHRRVLFGMSRMKLYKMSGIKAPCYGPSYRTGRRRHPSGIDFTYEGKGIRLCRGVTQSEAKEIVDAVLRQFPELVPVWASYTEVVPEKTHFGTLVLR
jgi:hypothetical protein